MTKQAVYKRFKGKLNTACAPHTHTEDGILYLDELGEQIIKNDFLNTYHSNRDILERSNGSVEHSIGALSVKSEKTPENQEIYGAFSETDGVSETGKIALERSNNGVERSNGASVNDSLKAEYVAEIEFLHRQIDRLQDELEKEREHNREKDLQLLDTLTKLAETQAALAVGQSAEKQKALAETLIDGQQKFEDEYRGSTDIAADVGYDESLKNPSPKSGWIRRALDFFIGK